MAMTERTAAEVLVRLLLCRHYLDGIATEPKVWVESNFKIKFHFTLRGLAPHQRRFGRRPALEMDWHFCSGDVDAWNPLGGDLLSLFGHGVQVVREHLGFNAEKPSKLLRIAVKQEWKKRA